MKRSAVAMIAIVAVATVALFHGKDIEGALLANDVELASACKVVLVNGEPDHCVVVIPGTDTPVPMPARR